MKRILIFLICLFGAYFVNAQVPAGFPSPSSNGFAKWGYVKTDSSGIAALRDTNWIPKYVGSWVYWQNPASDSSFWVFNNKAAGKKWDKVVMVSQGNINGYLKVTDTAAMLTGYLRNATIGFTVQPYNINTTLLGNTTTGTGSTIVLSGSPTLTTPTIASIINGGNTITVPSTAGLLALRSDTGRVPSILVTGGSLNKVRDSLVGLISAGGFGTVFSVATTNGAGIISSVANATTSPNITIRVDTNRTVSSIVTGGSLNKVRDSIVSIDQAALALKVNISDTAVMMSGYRRNSVNITNANLVNSTISGTALGGTLPNLNFGTYLQSGATSYNGSTAVTMTTNATSSNLGSTLVARDANGDFSARNITASLLGLASESSLATITNDVTSNITVYPTWVTANTGYLGLETSSSKLFFNPSTGLLTSTSFAGNLSGNATTASTLQTPRTINGVAFDGSANITISASVSNAISAGYGLSGSNYDGSLARTWTADTTKVMPYTDTLAIWGIASKAFVRSFLSLTTTGTSGAASYSSNTGVVNIPQYQAAYSELSIIGALTSVGVLQRTGTNTLTYTTTPTLTGTNFSGIPNVALTNSAITIQGTSTSLGGSINVINGTGFVKASGTTISYDNSTYLTTATAASTYSPIAGSASITTLGTIASGSIPYSLLTGTPSLTTYVPYTGATGAVNLGTNTLASGAITSSGVVQGLSINIPSTVFGTGTPSYQNIIQYGNINTYASIQGGNINNTDFSTFLKFRTNGTASNTPIDALILSNTGGATFSSSVSAVNTITTKGSGAYNGQVIADNTGTTGGGSFQVYQNGASQGSISVSGTYIGSTDANMGYYASTGLGHKFFVNATATPVLTLASTGVATFSSLAGTGSRIVTADASGALTATTANTISGITLGSNLATLTFGTHITGTSYNGSTGVTIATDAATAATVSTIAARDASGYIYAVSFFESSDARLKNIISRSNDMVLFKWKPELKRDIKTHIGYIAQEVQKVIPDAVKEDENGNLNVDYIQVLVKKVNDLEIEVKKLKARK